LPVPFLACAPAAASHSPSFAKMRPSRRNLWRIEPQPIVSRSTTPTRAAVGIRCTRRRWRYRPRRARTGRHAASSTLGSEATAYQHCAMPQLRARPPRQEPRRSSDNTASGGRTGSLLSCMSTSPSATHRAGYSKRDSGPHRCTACCERSPRESARRPVVG
jgi:hypothetical protein